jgi:Putative Flp pilus-assembly TadE/G-like
MSARLKCGASRGQVLVISALIIGVLLGFAVLTTDVLLMYWGKVRLQSAIDAGALAGARFIGNNHFTQPIATGCAYPTTAQNAACTYAVNNGVAMSEITAITPDAASNTLTMTGKRRVPATFARVLGYDHFDVSATAVANLAAIGVASGVTPIGLDFRTPYVYGQTIVMHSGGCGPGCWGGLQLPGVLGNSGGSAFKYNLANGCTCTVHVGDTIQSETGATSGPTSTGVAARVSSGAAQFPNDTWNNFDPNDPRAAIVPLVDWSGCNGSCTVTVKGFAEVWISGASGTDVNAIFIKTVTSAPPSSTAINAGLYHVSLSR